MSVIASLPMGRRLSGTIVLFAALGCHRNDATRSSAPLSTKAAARATPALAPPSASSLPTASAGAAAPDSAPAATEFAAAQAPSASARDAGAARKPPRDARPSESPFVQSVYQARARVEFTEPTVDGASLDARRHAFGFRPGYRSCFVRELDRDPEASGTLAARIALDADGKILRIDLTPSGRFSAQFIACCRARAFVVPFLPTEDHRPATLSLAATFTLLPPRPE